MDSIIVDKKTLVYELLKKKPFNPNILHEEPKPWLDLYQDRCGVERPMMKNWVRHVCEDHDVLLEWR